MITSRIEFSVNFKTNFGENVYICGNIPDLGNWCPEKSLKMHTDKHLYPVWNSNKTINVRKSTRIEFKVCILDDQGKLIRWENLPHNYNRQLYITCDAIVSFSENNQTVHQKEYSSSPQRANAVDIFKGKYIGVDSQDSDSSSGKIMWQEKIKQKDDKQNYYIDLITSMQRNVQFQSQNEIQFCIRQSDSYFTQSSNIKNRRISNFYLNTQKENQVFQECPQEISNDMKGKQQQVKTSDELEKNKIKDQVQYFHKLIAKQLKLLKEQNKNTVIAVHLHLKKSNKQLVSKIIQMNFNWKVVIHVDQTANTQAIQILKLGVNMLVFEKQQNIKQFVNLCKDNKLIVKMIKISCLSVDLPQYKYSLLHWNFCAHLKMFKVIQGLQIDQQVQNKLNKINLSLMQASHYNLNNEFFQNIIHKTLKFDSPEYSKRYFLILVENMKELNHKIIRYLISLSDKKNTEIYIFQRQPLIDINKLPSSIENKLLVLSSAGQIYCSRQRHVNIYQKLNVPLDRVRENISKIAKQLQDESKCKIVQNDTYLEIEFQSGEIGEYIRRYIFEQVRNLNSKTVHKLTISENQLGNKLSIRPYCVSSKFFFKTIISNFMKASFQISKNTLNFIDFSCQDRIMNFIDRQLQNYQQNSYHYNKFCCRSSHHSQPNYSQPVINETNLIEILRKMYEHSESQFSFNLKHRHSDYYCIQTP